MPFGVAIKESSDIIGWKHRSSDRWIGYAKIGYIDSKNNTTGGNTNFRGPVGYVSCAYSL